MIAIIDYGAGNIKSLQFALDKLNKHSIVTTDATEIKQAESIILPGVGAFKDAMDAIRQLHLDTVLQEEAQKGKPILGICLGMQLFYEQSLENGDWEGLGLLKGSIERISSEVKVPHMGWNTLDIQQTSPLFDSKQENPYAYFVHSYAVSSYEKNTLLASSQYGQLIPAIVQKGNITGMQFHPEKSGEFGIELLKRYEEMIV
ncbi:imidazole glycerol phosphate synthase subunit HisH [Oceanobacillus sp. 1P07AA]|uniref:imidazole glycerol phosphate synthase subunit HisH n=1 Tax=Oceanobacillus sp. 1P07AA TaxID=3132293 RepID=UPI0039A4886C